ncbi:hypothetical protein X474_06580 [Dethiosulfatarculus sandiegensis]|uniref:Uncharacterized protein n=1 Tax=Dethiosulfatarculus sandiegensis TaxID=1429043 RepID=A0A0D2JZ22_9BACT|nr:hypothetical protein X474_06580 [Dethiosulfatarculus sandiegensis]
MIFEVLNYGGPRSFSKPESNIFSECAFVLFKAPTLRGLGQPRRELS